jgi:ABC-type transporter Mla MlaB component
MRIDLDGDCTVAVARTIKDLLQNALAGGEPTQVSLAGVTRADLSLFELLWAARQGFSNQGVELVILPDIPEHLEQAAAWTGLAELRPPRADAVNQAPGNAKDMSS